MNKLNILIATSFSFLASSVTLAITPEGKKTEMYFSTLVKEKRYAELTQFLNKMPKGGDLHHHFSGSLYFEDYLNFLEDKNGQINISTNTEYNFCLLTENAEDNKGKLRLQYTIIDREAVELKPAYKDSCLPIANLKLDANKTLYTQVQKAWSMWEHFNDNLTPDTSYNHFFNTFIYFSEFAKSNTAQGLNKIIKRAESEKVTYIETMLESSVSINPEKSSNYENIKGLANSLSCNSTQCDTSKLESDIKKLLKDLSNDSKFNAEIVKQADVLTGIYDKLDKKNVEVKFQTYATRNKQPVDVVSGMYSAFKLATLAPNVIVGVNLVSAEHSAYSMDNYKVHMAVLKQLKNDYSNINLALHAGELVLGLVEPEKLTTNIRDAVDTGAKRIGHGVSIGYEDPSVLKSLASQKVAVEINLTSNEVILGIKDDHHPIKLYSAKNVPIVISTDDSGVSRNNLTNEYFKYVTRYHPSYKTLKQTVTNSIEYSFLPKTEKDTLLKKLGKNFEKFEHNVSNYIEK